jgi:hypothetical protein
MKVLLTILVLGFSLNVFAGDYSESGSELDTRVYDGCVKYAEKQAKIALGDYFNMNFWAGGNVGAGSVLSAEEALPNHISFLTAQCYNMVAEVLELKLGYAPWQEK